MPPEQLFKTLVLTGAKGDLFVCVIPCAEEVDLKKAARVMGEKSAAMLPVKQLLEKTGYVRGGCSPIGMKKKLPTFIDETALLHERIAVSAGVRGTMALIDPNHLIDYTGAKLADLTLV